MAVSDRQFSGVGEAVCLSQVVGEFPELGLKEGVEYPDLVTLFFVEGADMRNVPLIDCCLKPVNTKKCFVLFFLPVNAVYFYCPDWCFSLCNAFLEES